MKLLLETEDVSIIESIKQVFQKKYHDKEDDLPEALRESIDAGLKDIAEGRVVPYEEVKKKYGW
ncbi:hypothetical protein [Flavobacterium sp.]|uniref:hypothetical protein n=1 Tax=Flavobacterium sp. TaxID=239 RepID=UPI003D0C5025